MEERQGFLKVFRSSAEKLYNRDWQREPTSTMRWAKETMFFLDPRMPCTRTHVGGGLPVLSLSLHRTCKHSGKTVENGTNLRSPYHPLQMRQKCLIWRSKPTGADAAHPAELHCNLWPTQG